jgi:hypothetical protein
MGHLRSKHGLSRQQAYDVQFKKPRDGTCNRCKKPTQFYKHRKMFGYQVFCGPTCRSLSSKLITNVNPDKDRISRICSINGRRTKGKFSKELRDKLSIMRTEKNKSGIGYKKYHYRGATMKSSWELEFAQKCDILGIQWQYEPETFILRGDRRFRYTPDFFLPAAQRWVEVKPRPLINAQVLGKQQHLIKLGHQLDIISKDQFDEFLASVGKVG